MQPIETKRLPAPRCLGKVWGKLGKSVIIAKIIEAALFIANFLPK